MTIRKLLVVDDSEAEHFLYRHALRKFDPGIEVVSVYDGHEALKLLDGFAAEEMPDFLLLDINMPRMDGAEFLEAFHARYADAPVRIVMLTSSLNDRDREKALSYPHVAGFMTKPLGQEDLARLAGMAEESS